MGKYRASEEVIYRSIGGLVIFFGKFRFPVRSGEFYSLVRGPVNRLISGPRISPFISPFAPAPYQPVARLLVGLLINMTLCGYPFLVECQLCLKPLLLSCMSPFMRQKLPRNLTPRFAKLAFSTRAGETVKRRACVAYLRLTFQRAKLRGLIF